MGIESGEGGAVGGGGSKVIQSAHSTQSSHCNDSKLARDFLFAVKMFGVEKGRVFPKGKG